MITDTIAERTTDNAMTNVVVNPSAASISFYLLFLFSTANMIPRIINASITGTAIIKMYGNVDAHLGACHPVIMS